MHHGTKIGDRECMQYICQRLKSTFSKTIRFDLTVKSLLKVMKYQQPSTTNVVYFHGTLGVLEKVFSKNLLTDCLTKKKKKKKEPVIAYAKTP